MHYFNMAITMIRCINNDKSNTVTPRMMRTNASMEDVTNEHDEQSIGREARSTIDIYVLSSIYLLHLLQLSLNLMHKFLSNFNCWLPWQICPGYFLLFGKKRHFSIFRDFFFFCLFSVPSGYMGLK